MIDYKTPEDLADDMELYFDQDSDVFDDDEFWINCEVEVETMTKNQSAKFKEYCLEELSDAGKRILDKLEIEYEDA